jgi:NAD(P)-dependent dehydrogenase (short-subunit alcohol dehydrogenase family)
VAALEGGVKNSLKDRVIVITGAARGIGYATARALAAEGAVLVLDDIRTLDPDARPSWLGNGARVTAVEADVRVSTEVEALAEHAIATWGRVDAVVNCAGVVAPGAIDTSPAEDVALQLDTNLVGTINVARAFVPHFRRQGSGHLVLIASLAGIVPLPGESIYAATKFAVRGFAHSLALELRGTSIEITDVCPDSTRTAMLEIETGDDGSSLSFASAAMEPEQVARAIVGVLKRPRVEVLVPRARGWVIRLLGAAPGLFGRIYPLIDAMGRRRKARYRSALVQTRPV